MGMPTSGPEHIIRELFGKCPHLLKRHNVDFLPLQHLQKALLRASTQPINIPANYSHSLFTHLE
jgi:hypothetical protein